VLYKVKGKLAQRSVVTVREGTVSIADCAFCTEDSEYGPNDSGDKNLVFVKLPDSLENIGNEAFKDNTNLTDVIIPSTITSIGESAFAGCSNLKSITVNSTTPIVFPSASRTRGGSSVFEGVDKTTCILYVPEGSVELYKTAPGWSEFQNIKPISSTDIKELLMTDGEMHDIYDLQGRKVKVKASSPDGLPKGIYIINGKKMILK
jgi:hypothetical protein